MATGTLTITANVGGIQIMKTITKTGDAAAVYGDSDALIALPAGKAVTDWVRTDADTAACNLPTSHGYSSGKMDVFWAESGVNKCRYDVNGVVDTNALTLDGGTGDDFPASATTGIVVTTPVQINTAIDGDEVEMLVINSTVVASVYFEDASGDAIGQVDLEDNEPYVWHSTCRHTNPVTGDPVTVCFASNGTTTAGVLTILVLSDSTP